jgi:UDP-N-acetylglucosamine/UDP-N-acetylgalactosamine diphosphorylase
MKNLVSVKKKLIKFDQLHLLKFLELKKSKNKIKNSQEEFISSLQKIDFKFIKSLFKNGKNKIKKNFIENDFSLPKFIPLAISSKEKIEWKIYELIGRKIIKKGLVAIITVSGGQGTRLGFKGPKGCFPISPILKKSLFQLFAEKILSENIRYNKEFLWFIMTSHNNHKKITNFFKKNNYFCLSKEKIFFFQQPSLPSLNLNGKIILSDKLKISMQPDGHGGLFEAIKNSKILEISKQFNIKYFSYCQIDNPLVKIFDPYFIGLHFQFSSNFSCKMITKKNIDEKVGIFLKNKKNKKTFLFEYNNLKNLFIKNKKFLKFGNPAIHLINVSFIKKIIQNINLFSKVFPYYSILKKIPFCNKNGKIINPKKENGIKFERFIFDGLPFAKNTIILEINRKEEFSPIKNSGELDNSPESTRKNLVNLYLKWIFSVIDSDKKKFIFLKKKKRLKNFNIEISPIFANSKQEFIEKWNILKKKPKIKSGLVL